MGRCNCGHLVQTLTDMTDIEIVQSITYQLDEWTERAKDYCEGTSTKVQDLFDTLTRYGLGHEDLRHSVHLSDRRALNRIDGRPYFRKNIVSDVSLYMDTMADFLEEK